MDVGYGDCIMHLSVLHRKVARRSTVARIEKKGPWLRRITIPM
jgi:hypothetical protein